MESKNKDLKHGISAIEKELIRLKAVMEEEGKKTTLPKLNDRVELLSEEVEKLKKEVKTINIKINNICSSKTGFFKKKFEKVVDMLAEEE